MDGSKSDEELNKSTDPLYQNRKKTRTNSKGSGNAVGPAESEREKEKVNRRSRIVDEDEEEERERRSANNNNNSSSSSSSNAKKKEEIHEDPSGADAEDEFVDVEQDKPPSGPPVVKAEVVQSMDDLLGKPHKKRFKVLRRKKKVKESRPRTIYCNDPLKNINNYAVNSIKTTKYTVITFLPKNLFEQFRRVANFYFLVVACIQLVPGLSAISPYSSIIPLIIVLSVTAVKEGIEDFRRSQSDRQTNSAPCMVLRNGEFMEIPWSQVVVGDILKVSNGDLLPADLVLLNSSENQGMCYVETSNLDGETNLKLHQAIPETHYLKDTADLSSFDSIVECEGPNNRLYNFNGLFRINGQEKPLGVKQVLLRGCLLKNTHWVYGLVIYTGAETKLMQNATSPPSKRTLLEKRTNRALFILFMIMFSVCAVGAIGGGIWTKINGKKNWYIEQKDSAGLTGFLNFFTFIINFSVMIPISLYVSMEMVKVAQALLIGSDIEMYYAEKDTPARARTSNLSEELGQVQYIFSDKTGTLTRNIMEFFKCSINGVSYGTGLTEIAITKAKREGRTIKNADDEPLPNTDPGFTFNDRRLMLDLEHEDRRHRIKEFFTLLATCHTVIPERDEEDNKKIIYQAASPDEGALVYAAKNLGFFFHTRNPKDIICNILGEDIQYKILNVLEFNSTRKRMSVIVEDGEGNIKLYCKGADTVIYERMKPGQDDLKEKTSKHLEDYASDGLRTLCLAYTEIDRREYEKWNISFHEASIALKHREDKLDACAEEIEKNLILIGATAIEDKLQEGVPTAIFTLAKANIKIWVLTGDKQETAINIGFACSLLTESMTIMIINATSAADTEKQIDNALEQSVVDGEYGLVIDGHTLLFALSAEMSKRLLMLAQRCKAVICCRVSPLQKAQVVTLVKYNLKAITLAIGDGANDVSMIQQAHIGVGISGQEGMQAVMNSDYAIAQFRFLTRLLIIHGRLDYKRVTKLILYSFYKNMVFSLTQFGFNWFNGFSASTMYDGWSITIFNVVFTGLPVIIYAIFEQDIAIDVLKKYPQLYQTGQRSEEFNMKLLGYWLLTGVYQAFMIFFGAFLMYKYGIIQPSGHASGESSFGALCYFTVILTVNVRLALEIRNWTWMTAFFISLCVLIWFCWIALIGAFPYFITDGSMYGIARNLLGTGVFWFGVLFLLVLAMAPVLAVEYYKRTYRPQPHHIVQELAMLERKGIYTPPDVEMPMFLNMAPDATSSPNLKASSSNPLISSSSSIITPPSPPAPFPPPAVVRSSAGSPHPIRRSLSEVQQDDKFTGFAFEKDESGKEVIRKNFKRQNTSSKNEQFGHAHV